MASLEAQHLLDQAIIDYISKRGFHQISAAFSREVFANQNSEAINSPHEAFLQRWWGKFYEAYNCRFPDIPLFIAESFDKVANTVENVVTNNIPANDHTRVTISNAMPVMSSPPLMISSPVMEFSGPDDTEAMIAELVSIDIPSISQKLDMNEMDGILPFASNVGYQMSIVPPGWNSRDERLDINLGGGPMLMNPNSHAPENALSTTSKLSGNNLSLQQASHQGWPYVVLGDTNKKSSENLSIGKQIIAPTDGIMKNNGKLPAVQSGKKRKTPLSSLASVEKEKAIVVGIAKGNTKSRDAGLVRASNSNYALAERAKWKGISFKEIHNFYTTKSKLLCCHFDSQGELLATAGDDRKVSIWELRSNNVNSREGHIHDITDVRFKPNSTVFATSSLDKTVKIWDAAKPNDPFRNLVGHDEHVMSIDFHPTKVNLISSCDSNDEIRLWNISRRDCKHILKGGSKQVRFKPHLGDLLASSTGNIINIFDVETNNILKKLQGHVKNIRSICWDMTGYNLASVSEDSARIWSIREGRCIFELFSGDCKFQSCTFHPGHNLVLVIGSDKVLDFWNPFFQRNITWSYNAHAGIISSLVDSPSKRIIASVSDDQLIKIWR